jgi:hypothetical protein
MTEGATFWFIVGAAAALLYFGIAGVVMVRGIGDLRDLLRRTERREGRVNSR